MIGAHEAGRHLERRAKVGDRPIMVAAGGVGQAPIIVRPGKAGIQLDGVGVISKGGIPILLGRIEGTPIIVGIGIRRFEP